MSILKDIGDDGMLKNLQLISIFPDFRKCHGIFHTSLFHYDRDINGRLVHERNGKIGFYK